MRKITVDQLMQYPEGTMYLVHHSDLVHLFKSIDVPIPELNGFIGPFTLRHTPTLVNPYKNMTGLEMMIDAMSFDSMAAMEEISSFYNRFGEDIVDCRDVAFIYVLESSELTLLYCKLQDAAIALNNYPEPEPIGIRTAPRSLPVHSRVIERNADFYLNPGKMYELDKRSLM